MALIAYMSKLLQLLKIHKRIRREGKRQLGRLAFLQTRFEVMPSEIATSLV